jgi:hypothetical protein
MCDSNGRLIRMIVGQVQVQVPNDPTFPFIKGMDGATLRKCSEFAEDIIAQM